MRTPACHTLLHNIRAAIVDAPPDWFHRKRGIMPPAVAMVCLLSMTALGMRTGYEPLMTAMLATLGTQWNWSGRPAASTFCRARQKLTQAMLDAVLLAIHRAAGPTLATFMPRVRGHRLVAIDGSWITVPNSKVLRRALGVHRIGPQRRSMRRPQVLLVVLTDAITRMPIARIALRGDGSEREAARALLRHLRPDDILLADRGYQGREILAAIHATGCRYVLRVPGGTGAWREFRQLQRQRVRDARISITVGSESIQLRHLRVSGGPGRPRTNSKRETQFLLSNLPATWSTKRIAKLYAARWGVETMFRELKVTLEGGGLHARTHQGVLQELDARCIHLTIAAYLDIAALVEAGMLSRAHAVSVNRSALLMIVTIMIILPDDDPERRRRSAQAAVDTARAAQAKRPGKYAPRKKPMFAKVR
jgi:hypothetical protein